MALIARAYGWEDNPETGEPEFVVRLIATTQEDVPDLTWGDVWDETPLLLVRAKKEAASPEHLTDVEEA